MRPIRHARGTPLATLVLAGAVAPAVAGGEPLPRLLSSVDAVLAPVDLATGDGFGRSVALSGDTLLVGVPLDDHAAGQDAGTAVVFVRQGSAWVEEARLVASDAGAGDQLGIAVALDGDLALVGAWRDDDGGVDAGAAYVFVRSGTQWTEERKLVSPSPAGNDQLGLSVALDGGTALVGARFADGAAPNQGKAFAFVRAGGAWTLEAELALATPSGGDRFGEAVALDGDRALIGAVWTDGLVPNCGEAYVFERAGTVWTQAARLTSTAATTGALVGSAVALDGDVALVGAPGVEEAYVFERPGSTGATWSQVSTLRGLRTAELFGASVALDGRRGAVGAPRADGGRGRVVLVDGRYGPWGVERPLPVSTADADDGLGEALALQGDELVAGASRDEAAGAALDSGTVRVARIELDPAAAYARDVLVAPAGTSYRDAPVALEGDTAAIGSLGAETATIVSLASGDATVLVAPDGLVGDGFGGAVALAGTRVAVGAPYDDLTTGTLAGSVYVFVKSGTSWVFERKLRPADSAPFQRFGASVAFAGESTLLVGAPEDDAAGPNAGAVYVFELGGGGWTETAKLLASVTEFGFGASLSGDGVRVAVGGGPSTVVLHRDAQGWGELQRIEASGSVALDGATLAIATCPYLADAGVRVYRENGGVFALEAELDPAGATCDGQGAGLAVRGDTLLLGAPYVDDGDVLRVGALVAYHRVGDAWLRHPLRLFARQASTFANLRRVALDGCVAVATAGDARFAHVFDVGAEAFPSFCDGLDGALEACPCGNAGNPDAGCDLPQGTGGVRLRVLGQATQPANRMTLEATGYPVMGTATTVLLRSGGLEPAPVVFGDGLRCVGVPSVRLSSGVAQGGALLLFPPHGATAGSGTFFYQAWFRSTPAGFCTPDAFNLSNGRAATW